jgi:hypothetical protein
MKKTITILSLALTSLVANSQTVVADFETFTLTTNSFYKDTNDVPFQTNNAIFRYEWTGGPFPYWSGGFSYTNVQDSSTATSSNLYGNKALKGYNNSNNFVIGKPGSFIKLIAPQNKVDGFYITNTTFTYKTIRNGNMFSRKFGDTTGTKTGTLYPQGGYPDYFKITAKGYLNGAMKTDSSVVFLADYRFTSNSMDFVSDTWQWFNTSNLGQIDSLTFKMYSSDVGQYGINTPLFFSLDNFTTSKTIVGLTELSLGNNLNVYPNPFTSQLNIKNKSKEKISLKVLNITGQIVFKEELVDEDNSVNLSILNSGIYFLKITNGETSITKKVIKE